MKKVRIFIYIIILLFIFNIRVDAASLRCVYDHLVVTYDTDTYKFSATSDTPNYIEYEHRLTPANFTTSTGQLMCLDNLYVVSYGYIGGRKTKYVMSIYKKDATLLGGKPYGVPYNPSTSYVDNGGSSSSSKSSAGGSQGGGSHGGGSQGGGSQGGGSQGGSVSSKSSSSSASRSTGSSSSSSSSKSGSSTAGASTGGTPSRSSSSSNSSSSSKSGSSTAGASTGGTPSRSSSSSGPEEFTCAYSSGSITAALKFNKTTKEITKIPGNCEGGLNTDLTADDFSNGTCPAAKLITNGGRGGTGIYCNISKDYGSGSAPSAEPPADSIQSYNNLPPSNNSFKIPDIGGGDGFGKSANCKKVLGDSGYNLVNGLIKIVRILAPIVATLVAMITLIPAITAKDEDKVKAATKKCVTIGIVLLVIEVIPYIVRLIGVIIGYDLSCIG